MHFQLKNGQLVPVSEEIHKQQLADSKDPNKGVIQMADKLREGRAKTKQVDPKVTEQLSTVTQQKSNVTNSLPEVSKKEGATYELVDPNDPSKGVREVEKKTDANPTVEVKTETPVDSTNHELHL